MKKENINPIESFHAPATRATQETVNSEHELLSTDVYFQMFIEAMPDVAMVVNYERQVIYANKALLRLISEQDILDNLGMRPGELFRCMNLNDTSNGCGTTKACRFCGLVNSILEAERNGKPAIYESHISSKAINNGRTYDVEVKTSPIIVRDQTFYIISIKDISDKKRRLILEKIFFHDILNTATGLNGIIMALEDHENSAEMRQIIDYAKKAGGSLVDEIMAHRILVLAEHNDLELNITRCNSLQILQDVSGYLSYHEIASAKKIFIDPFSHNSLFDTDAIILKRVLINVVKNALEACNEGDIIQMGSRITDKYVNFWINNPGFIPEDVQVQLFQRSFSTKGKDRGVGTYSIKLLAEHYLGGEVTFNTSQEKGTTFYINIPLSSKKS
ncbi:MAG: HAMP domain-containing sensor histidine kinase [Lentimicrobium sp.]|jgi:hypothetical protein|nr:HAMP domain-containing sensor histidine kinase [Lentimicrobium sp.]